MQNPLDQRTRHISDLLTIFIICLVVYFVPTSLRPLANPDEGRYSEIPREMVQSGDWVTPRLNGVLYFYKPPMFYWMQAASIDTFGINRAAVRLPNSLMAIFGIMFTYIAARSIYGRAAGIFSAAVLATTVLYYAMGSIVLLDMTVSVFISATLFSFVLAWREKESTKKRSFFWILTFVFCGLAVMTKGLIGILIPACIAFLYLFVMGPISSLKQIRKSDIFSWVAGLAMFFAIAVPWHVLAALATPALENSEGLFSKNPEGQGFAWYYFINEHFLRYLDAGTSHRYQPFWFFWVIVPIGFIPWLFFLPRALYHSFKNGWAALKRENPEIIFFSIWVLFVIFFFSISKSKLVPYILPVYPALAIPVGLLISKIWKDPKKYTLKFEAYALAALGLIAAIAVIPVFMIFANDGKIIDPEVGRWSFFATSLFLFVGSLCTLILIIKKRPRHGIVAVFVTLGAFLFMFNPFGRHVQRADTQSFAQIIKSQRAPRDRVIAAYSYGDAQDLPFWLNELVSLYAPAEGNPHGVPPEQLFGFNREPQKLTDRYLSTDDFKRVLKSEGVFIVAKDNRLNEVMNIEGARNLREIDRMGRLVLLTNKPETDEK